MLVFYLTFEQHLNCKSSLVVFIASSAVACLVFKTAMNNLNRNGALLRSSTGFIEADFFNNGSAVAPSGSFQFSVQ